MLTSRSQRWRDRRCRYVDSLSLIDPSALAVDVIEPSAARAFVAAHHYLPNWPAARLAVGLFGPGPARSTRLVGVAVFAVPAIGQVITHHSGMPNAAQGCVLARFVLLDEVAGNGESFTLARAFRLLRAEKSEVEAVVSYSDPLAGHIGGCYAAMSSAYRGITRPRTQYRIAGRTISGRTLSKIRLGEQGAGGAIDQLVAAGAPRPMISEPICEWLARLSRERVLVRAQHPGLHAYCFELTRRARSLGRGLARKPYPKVLALPHPELPFLQAA